MKRRIDNPESIEVREAESLIFAAEPGSPKALDLHEMDVLDAERLVDLFLNQQFMAGERVAKIVHGRGSGKLRDAIHQLLKDHPLIEYYRDAQAPHSVAGVTYAVLEKRD